MFGSVLWEVLHEVTIAEESASLYRLLLEHVELADSLAGMELGLAGDRGFVLLLDFGLESLVDFVVLEVNVFFDLLKFGDPSLVTQSFFFSLVEDCHATGLSDRIVPENTTF